MGKWNPRYILGGFLIIASIATFQNCGQSYNANGDPYESDPPTGIEPNPPGDGNIPEDPIVGDRICSSTEGNVVLVTTGILNNVSSVRVKTVKSSATYPWTSSTNSLVVNQPLDELTISNITLDKKSVTVRLKVNGATLDETLKCH